jgi:glycosyltransferase involved in cell wall biosynthesis
MSETRNILLLVSSMTGGGAERVAALLANHWVAVGNQVTLLATYGEPVESAYVLDERITVRQLDQTAAPNRARANVRMLTQFQRLRSLRRIIKELQPDNVVSFLTNVNVAAILAGWGTGVATIVSERIHPAQFPISYGLANLRKLTYPHATRVVVQTAVTQRWFAAHVASANVDVIPNPVAWPLAATEPIVLPESLLADDDKLLLAVGRLDVQKGFEDLIAAFASLSPQLDGWKLVILGEGGLRTDIETLIESLGLADSVLLPGWAGNVADWYARAQMFVLSSHIEGFPNALLEAMSHGVACVSYDCATGPAEIIRDGIDGRLVPLAAGADGLAAAINELGENEETRTQFATRAKQVRQRFAPEKIMLEWDRLLEATAQQLS